jgi:YD repeat-containing protein
VGNTPGRFRITHPFHPLRGAEYELVTRKLAWGEDRVFYYDQAGALKSFLSNVTDLAPEDAFGRVSAGRSAFRADDLLELRRLIDRCGRRDDKAKEV